MQSDQATYGVVPFENSTNGPVVYTLELLADRASVHPDVIICGEAYLSVNHCLLGHQVKTDSPLLSGACTPTSRNPSPLQSAVKPTSDLSHIRKVYTHPQAWGQCELFLQTYLKGVERIDVSSTSKAAEIVAGDVTGTSAAIASFLAADIHRLDVLSKGIEDKEDNKTRFLVLRKGIQESNVASDGCTKSLISFTVPHHTPGALADVLDCFKRFELNLTSINSRPTKIVPFEYIFFIEFEGSKLVDPEGRVAGALDAVDKIAFGWKWLGSWKNNFWR